MEKEKWTTRLDTWKYSRGRLGRSSNAKNHSKFKNVTDIRTDRHGKVYRRVSATKNWKYSWWRTSGGCPGSVYRVAGLDKLGIAPVAISIACVAIIFYFFFWSHENSTINTDNFVPSLTNKNLDEWVSVCAQLCISMFCLSGKMEVLIASLQSRTAGTIEDALFKQDKFWDKCESQFIGVFLGPSILWSICVTVTPVLNS